MNNPGFGTKLSLYFVLLCVLFGPVVIADTSTSVVGSDDVAERVEKYCFSNNDDWRDRICMAIIDELDCHLDSGHDKIQLRLVLARAYEGIAVYSRILKRKKWAAEKRSMIYERILEKDPNNTEVLYLYSNSLPVERSIEVLRQLLAVDPNHYLGRTMLGLKLTQLGDNNRLEEAKEHFKVAYLYAPDGMKQLSAMNAYRAVASISSAMEAREYRDFLRTDMNVDRYISDATLAVNSKNTLEAKLEAVKNIVDRFCPRAYMMIGDSLTCEKGLAFLEQLLSEYPTSTDIFQVLIQGRTQLSNLDSQKTPELIDTYKRLLDVNPHSTAIQYQYAQLLSPDKARQLLLAILERDPDAPAQVHWSLANNYRSTGEVKIALQELEKAFELADDKGKRSYGYNLIELYRELEMEGKARRVENLLRNVD